MEIPQAYNIGVLGKAFRIVELMSHQAKWELQELTKASGLPKGTLQRILLTLCSLGYVAHESRGGAYSLTLKFYKIGQRIASNNNLADKARPVCRKLMEKVNETVNLCVAQNLDMVVIDQQVSWQSLRLDSIIGSSFPIFPSASGKIYCAFLSERELLNYLNELRTVNPQLPVETVNRFCDELAQVRREGIAFDCEEIFHGVRCVAAPVFNYTNSLVATIGCSVPTVRINEQSSAQLIQEVSRAAAELSSVLGSTAHQFAPTTRSMLDDIRILEA